VSGGQLEGFAVVDEMHLWVLDAMADDIEDAAAIVRYLTVFSVPVIEAAVLATLASLLREDLVEAYDEVSGEAAFHWVAQPEFTPAALGRYWFRPTRAGRQLWDAWPGPNVDSSDTL
jgi:hypothetical protein